MATTVTSFTTSEITVRYREPQLTDSLNRKIANIVPAGIYRGFKLAAFNNGATAWTLSVVGQAAPFSDNVAVVLDADGHAVTVRRASGSFNIVLSNVYASTTAVVGLYANYVLGTDTVAEIRAYTEAEYTALSAAAKRAIVVLGTVTFAAGGTYAVTDVTPRYRNEAWKELPPEYIAPGNLLTNGSFDVNPVTLITGSQRDYYYYGWQTTVSNASTEWRWSSNTTNGGFAQLYGVDLVNPLSGTLAQRLSVPVVPGSVVNVRFRKLANGAATGGTFEAFIEWGDASAAVLSETTIPITVNVGDGAFVEQSMVVAAPATAQFILRFGFRANALTYASAPLARVYVDEAHLSIDKTTAYEEKAQDIAIQNVMTDMLAFTTSVTDAGAPILVRGANTANSEPVLEMVRRDKNTSSSENRHPVLSLMRMIFGSGLLGNATRAARPRIRTQYDTTANYKTLIWESSDVAEGAATTRAPVRVWVNADGDFELTVNARWDNSTLLWSKDAAALPSSKLRLDASGELQTWVRDTTAGTWADTYTASTWQTPRFALTGGVELGSDLDNDVAGTAVPRIVGSGLETDSYQHLLAELDAGAFQAGAKVRIYWSTGGAFQFTYNSRNIAGTINWTSDVNAPAWSVTLSSEIQFNYIAAVVPGTNQGFGSRFQWDLNTGAATFFNTGKFDGDGTNTEPKIETTNDGGSNTAELLWKIPNANIVGQTWRVYAIHSASGEATISFVQGAWWNTGTSQWNADTGGSDVFRINLGRIFSMQKKTSGTASPWGEASWDAAEPFYLRSSPEDVFYLFGDSETTARVAMLVDGYGTYPLILNTAMPSDTGGNVEPHGVYSKNQIKAWAKIQPEVGANPTLMHGFNISSVSSNTTYITVNLGTTFTSADNICAVAGVENNNPATNIVVGAHVFSNSVVHIYLRDGSGTVIDPRTATARNVHLVVLGRHA